MKLSINNKNYELVIMNTFYKRLKGLMFMKDTINKIYVFPRCSSIHTYFMKQDIDICILDKNYKVVYLKEGLKPNRVLIKTGYYTLEMPLGLSKSLKLGDYLKLSI